MKREYPKNPFSRYADDAVAHCRSEAEAKRLLASIDKQKAGRDVLRSKVLPESIPHGTHRAD
jgi:retron-type reverse transcriptase